MSLPPVVAGTSSTTTINTAAAGATGHVFGGSQPIIGARVYLYAVSPTVGGTATSLVNGLGYVVTGSDGSYTLAPAGMAAYTCPAGDYVYLLALGGSPGLANGVNSKIALAAGLGACGSISTSSSFTINEVTTVAMAYSFVNYATSETQIGTNGSLAVPFSNITTLIDPVHGAAKPSTASTILPQAKLDSLADSIAACVNSSGSTSACTTLFSAANVTGSGGTPVDTFQAALSIATNPTTNVGAIYSLGTPSSAFAPTLSAAPTDWSLVPVPVSGCIVADANTYVMRTAQGDIAIELRPDVAPKNVANFLSYVNSGAYNGSFIDRVVAGFVDQGGYYTYSNGNVNVIPQSAPVVSEFNLSNVRGTLAMALTGNPNTATSAFFFNTADNSATLDTQSGGFTVIGQIAQIQGLYNGYGIGTCNSAGLAVMDAINADTVYNEGSPFYSIPLLNYSGGSVQASNFVAVSSIVPLTNTATTPATPVPNLSTGTYQGTQAITLTDSTPGAAIFYAVQPANSSSTPPAVQYTGPISISTGSTLFMYATAPGYANQSVVNAATYVIQ